jgi:hypothetical protein
VVDGTEAVGARVVGAVVVGAVVGGGAVVGCPTADPVVCGSCSGPALATPDIAERLTRTANDATTCRAMTLT